MLVIRMQRLGRKGHAQFRIVIQDSRRTPTSGKIVANIGHYNPHTKQTVVNKEKAQFYLDHGAQPSDRVALLLKSEGVKLPKWVNVDTKKKGDVKNPEKRRSTAPEQPAEEAPAETEELAEATEEVADEPASDEAQVSESSAEDASKEEVVAETEAEAVEPEDKPKEV